MIVWIDTETGTWGEAKNIRLVNLDDTSLHDSNTDAHSLLSFVEGGSDEERAEFGLRYGKQVELDDDF